MFLCSVSAWSLKLPSYLKLHLQNLHRNGLFTLNIFSATVFSATVFCIKMQTQCMRFYAISSIYSSLLYLLYKLLCIQSDFLVLYTIIYLHKDFLQWLFSLLQLNKLYNSFYNIKLTFPKPILKRLSNGAVLLSPLEKRIAQNAPRESGRPEVKVNGLAREMDSLNVGKWMVADDIGTKRQKGNDQITEYAWPKKIKSKRHQKTTQFYPRPQTFD